MYVKVDSSYIAFIIIFITFFIDILLLTSFFFCQGHKKYVLEILILFKILISTDSP